jgi:hypothetical protein
VNDSSSEAEWTPLNFEEAAARWRKKAEAHWRRSKELDELAVEAHRKAESADANAAMFEQLAEEVSSRHERSETPELADPS